MRRAGQGSMRRLLAALAVSSALAAGPACRGLVASNPGPYRTPVAVAVTADGLLAATANRASGSVTIVDLAEGRIIDEVSVGGRPTAIAADGGGGFVAVCESGDLVHLGVGSGGSAERRRVRVGLEPHAVAVAAGGTVAWVARAAGGDVARVDLVGAGGVSATVPVGPLPRFVALAPDGATLAVACAGGAEIDLVDTASATLRSRHPFKGLNVGQPVFTPDGATVYFASTYDGGGHPSPGDIRRGWVTGSRIGRLDPADGTLAGLTLDVPGRAVGDVLGVALADGGGTVLVTAGGTHEILRLDAAAGLPWGQISATEVMERDLAADASRFRRLELGGRPLGIVARPGTGTYLVANALSDEIQEIDPAGPDVVRSIALGRGETASDDERLRRRGEAIFHDARRSLDQWYSCHTCHWEGGGNTVTFDTLNDRSVGSYKTVLPLWHLAETGPWTWHGWQDDLNEAVRRSMIDTMQAPPPDDGDVAALSAFLAGLEAPPSPFRAADGSLSAAAERGRRVFESAAAGCTTCHAGPRFTTPDVHDVGTGRAEDRFPSYSVPTLSGGFRKTAWLHNARARSLESLLSGPHAPDKVAGLAPLTKEELDDLVAFLRSL